MKRRPFIWDLVKAFVGALLLVLIINHWIIKPVRVVGASMYPTLEDGQVGFSNILIHKIESVERFDVAILAIEQDGEEVYIVKRTIGLPNETIEMRDDVLYINNEPIEQPFFDNHWYQSIKKSMNGNFTSDFGPITLESDQYFFLGDNRRFSLDSRYYGPFESRDIVAKDLYILYPFQDIKIIRK